MANSLKQINGSNANFRKNRNLFTDFQIRDKSLISLCCNRGYFYLIYPLKNKVLIALISPHYKGFNLVD